MKGGSFERRKAFGIEIKKHKSHCIRLYTCKTDRTGCPPIRDTAASLISVIVSMRPSGTPSSTDVSTSDRTSSSESDQSSSPSGGMVLNYCWVSRTSVSSGFTERENGRSSVKHEWYNLVESSYSVKTKKLCPDRQTRHLNGSS